jgi:ABC-type polysaccharide/polyol phosphate export permease
MTSVWAIYLRGLLIVKRRAWRTFLSLTISPLLYAVAFGWGLSDSLKVEGVPYLYFMLPGLIALSGMNQAFGIGSELNIARFLNHVFEEFLLSPAGSVRIVAGNVLYGASKGILSFIVLALIGWSLGMNPLASPMVLVPVVLNCLVFASFGVWVALTVKTHRDMGSFTSFVITPMAFLSNTFFSIQKLPPILMGLANVIPLTHASIAIRGFMLGREVPFLHELILAGYFALFFALAVRQVRRAVD